ncbi:MAG: U32 family peptidase [Muribaculaceae bacterium]|nr:U32 family peptidase [Muribaculaceae bacterium]
MAKTKKRLLELLAPAADKHVAFQAILHGADAVYMGASSHGARKKAANSIEDIAEVVAFARPFRAKVYVTVNTLVYESEIPKVESLVRDLYRIGVDAIIVQDMALLKMNLPPISLHASTQCDTRTPEKARFLSEVGFSQIVLARELSIPEISHICDSVDVPVECFIHGALCVSYSGRCAASQVSLGRSANRGECAQMCRMPYTLRNGRGEVLERDRFLLSLRDFNATRSLPELVEAGVSSFKIEGRLKDAAYVKNVTAHYRRQLDMIIAGAPDRYCRSSYGQSEITFSPDPAKSFNRGFTDYFLAGRILGERMASLRTPKSMGEVVSDPKSLHNGDGISFFNEKGEYVGIGVNRVEGKRIIGSKPFRLPPGAVIHRTFDRQFQSELDRPTARRVIRVDIAIDEAGVSAVDERGVKVRIPLDVEKFPAQKPMDPRKVFSRLGDSVYELVNFVNNLDPKTFIRASELTALRRRLVDELDRANLASYPVELRRKENPEALYPSETLDERDNVANSLARSFYHEHGVKKISPAVEVAQTTTDSRVVMTTRYCLRRELGCCLRECKDKERLKRFAPPLTIATGPHTFMLSFDCERCEMNVVSPGKESDATVSRTSKGWAKR